MVRVVGRHVEPFRGRHSPGLRSWVSRVRRKGLILDACRMFLFPLCILAIGKSHGDELALSMRPPRPELQLTLDRAVSVKSPPPPPSGDAPARPPQGCRPLNQYRSALPAKLSTIIVPLRQNECGKSTLNIHVLMLNSSCASSVVYVVK